MRTIDVIIVGGGPAGSSCAWHLRRHGVDCLVLDKEAFPRSKLCAGWITNQVIEDLELDIPAYPHRFLSFDRLFFHFPVLGIRPLTLQHSIRRYEFDAWLLERSGAAVERHEVKTVLQEGDGYLVDGKYRCRYLVGAGGTRCPVYRNLFRRRYPRDKEKQVVTMEEEFPYDYADGRCHLWFFDKGLAGYGWYVPKAQGFVNVGIGGLATHLKRRDHDIRWHWKRLIRKLERQKLVNGHEFGNTGYSYYVRGDTGACRLGNAFVTGDAAGLATTDMGEGIGPAVRSGLMAAQAIVGQTPYEPGTIPDRSFDARRLLLAGILHRPYRARQQP